jgi:uncharacterized protein
MIAVDVSVLAPALNRWSPDHARAAGLLEDLVNGERPWALPWPVVHDLLSLVTHRHGVARPLPAADAIAFITQLLESPSVAAVGATPHHATVLQELVADLDDTGGITSRLELAAVLREHGVRELLSADSGMKRFGFLTVIDPLRHADWSPQSPPPRRYRRLRSG